MGIADNTPQKGYCIYAHRNKINGKVYIGISKNVKKRWAGKEENYKHSSAIYMVTTLKNIIVPKKQLMRLGEI